MTRERGPSSAPELPETVQGIIAARLDGLAPEERADLQDAAVVGKVFWLGALAAVGERRPLRVGAATARARAAPARAPRTSLVGGQRGRVRVLARPRPRRRLRADPARRARRQAPRDGRVDRLARARPRRRPGRADRAPLRVGARARACGRPRHGRVGDARARGAPRGRRARARAALVRAGNPLLRARRSRCGPRATPSGAYVLFGYGRARFAGADEGGEALEEARDRSSRQGTPRTPPPRRRCSASSPGCSAGPAESLAAAQRAGGHARRPPAVAREGVRAREPRPLPHARRPRRTKRSTPPRRRWSSRKRSATRSSAPSVAQQPRHRARQPRRPRRRCATWSNRSRSPSASGRPRASAATSTSRRRPGVGRVRARRRSCTSGASSWRTASARTAAFDSCTADVSVRPVARRMGRGANGLADEFIREVEAGSPHYQESQARGVRAWIAAWARRRRLALWPTTSECSSRRGSSASRRCCFPRSPGARPSSPPRAGRRSRCAGGGAAGYR